MQIMEMLTLQCFWIDWQTLLGEICTDALEAHESFMIGPKRTELGDSRVDSPPSRFPA